VNVRVVVVVVVVAGVALLLPSWLASCAGAPSTTSNAATHVLDADEIEQLSARYMVALDDRGADLTASAAQMEEELRPLVDDAWAASERNLDDGERGRAGLVLVYGALFLQRDLMHVKDGTVDAARLFAVHRYSDVDAREVHARRVRAVTLLERAAKLRPFDHRVPSWLAGARSVIDADAGMPPTAAGLDELVNAIDAAPTANLWTAFIAMRDVPVDAPAEHVLFEKTRAFVDKRICLEPAPDSDEARRCGSSPRAPFEAQTAAVMLGDQFLRRGEIALAHADVATAVPLLQQARDLYATLSAPANARATAAWHNRALLDGRVARIDDEMRAHLARDDGFWRSHDYEAIYDCASCHAR
jgi:hypothetical protein